MLEFTKKGDEMMKLLNTSYHNRETYEIKISYSLLYETALGIAAITNDRLIATMEQPSAFWTQIMDKASDKLRTDLDYVKENNTWKALLQLIHESKANTLKEFNVFMEELTEKQLKFICLPYLGVHSESIRKNAAQGDKGAINKLAELTSNRYSFTSPYVEFVTGTNTEELKSHLMRVLTEWYEVVIIPKEDFYHEILERDCKAKELKQSIIEAEELVMWATGGVEYAPEPSVHQVLLIPQYIYRPWTIQADLKGIKVFYYPVHNESIYPGDRFVPDQVLLQKHKALGDETRLKIIKLLAEKDYSLQELTDVIEAGKSTVHHHLSILKSAYLVKSNRTSYRLNHQALTSMHSELMQFLNQ